MSEPWKKREVIGDCVLYLGDCMEVMGALDKVDAVVTDPPFGMDFQSGYRMTKHKRIANDKSLDGLQFACEIPVTHSRYVFCRWDNLANLPKPTSAVTWIKNNWSMGDLEHEHARQTELCLFYRGPSHYFPNGRPQDVIKAPRTGNDNHPTEKPVGLMGAILAWTSGLVLDPFMGSGTTLVACAKTGRKGIGIELDEDYFEIACQRVREAYQQTDLFVAQPKQIEVQEELL